METLDMSQTWMNYDEPHQGLGARDEEQQNDHDDHSSVILHLPIPITKKSNDEVSVATPNTYMTGSSLSLQESFFDHFENLDFLTDDEMFSPRPPSLTTRKSLGVAPQPEKKKPDKVQKPRNSVSDFRSIDARHSAKKKSESAKKTTNLSFSDFRSMDARCVGMDGAITLIPSKAHNEPWSKLGRTSSMPIKQQGLRGRRPSKPERRSAVAPEQVRKSPVQRTKSMSARCCSSPGMKLVSSTPTRRHGSTKGSSIVRRNEVQSAIQDALAAYDCESPIPAAPKKKDATTTTVSPTPSPVSNEVPRTTVGEKSECSKILLSPAQKEETKNLSSPDRRSDFKVLYARTPSSSSSRRSDKSRVSELVMKVKKSRASFQKLIDESSHITETERRNRRASMGMQTSRSMYVHETSMEKQLQEKEEMIAKLSRQLEDARAMNQKNVREISSTASKPKRCSSTNTRVKRKSRARSSLPPPVTPSRNLSSCSARRSQSSKAKTPSRNLSSCSARSRNSKAKKGADDSDSVSGTRRKKKKEKAYNKTRDSLTAFVALCQQEDNSVASSRRKTKNRVSRSSAVVKKPRSWTSRVEGNAAKGPLGKEEPSRKIKRTKSEGQVRRSRA